MIILERIYSKMKRDFQDLALSKSFWVCFKKIYLNFSIYEGFRIGCAKQKK